MGIPIPAGVRTKKHVELGRYYLLYTCSGCGAAGLSEQRLERAEARSFSGLREQAAPELDEAAERGREPAAEEADRGLRTLQAQLAAGDCSALEKKLRCPRCGAVQPWSGMGRPWRRTFLAPLTVLAAVLSLVRLCFASPGAARGDGTAGSLPPWGSLILYILLPLGVMLLLDLGYVLRRKRRLARCRQSADRPAFYTREGLEALAEGPYSGLVKPYLRRL